MRTRPGVYIYVCILLFTLSSVCYRSYPSLHHDLTLSKFVQFTELLGRREGTSRTVATPTDTPARHQHSIHIQTDPSTWKLSKN